MNEQTTMSSNVTLSEVRGGAVEEMYQNALRNVLANIEDPNTPTGKKTKRKIVLTLEFAPFDDRSGANVDVSVKTSLQAAVPVQTMVTIKHDAKGLPVAHEPIQDTIPYSERN